jgi:hypothetical protein
MVRPAILAATGALPPGNNVHFPRGGERLPFLHGSAQGRVGGWTVKSITFLLSLPLVATLVAPLPAPAAERELLLAIVRKEAVLVVPKLTTKDPQWAATVTLLRGPLTVTPGMEYYPARYEFYQGVPENKPYRWRLVRDVFWGSGTAGVVRGGDGVQRIP